MTATATALTGLKRKRPEWGSWLDVVGETLRDVETAVWDAAVPARPDAPQTTGPLLAGATLAVDVRAARSLLRRLIRVASHDGTPQMATLRSVPNNDSEVLALFTASLCQNRHAIAEAATSCGADVGAFEAVIALLSVPFLQACNRAWGRSMCPSWLEGYCPLCGAWPAFAETRGIERSRFFRCGRCGGEWHARPLRCPYCRMDDHSALASLVPENAELNTVIEGCRSCRGYVKTFTRLQGGPPSTVMLDDLASVHLDIAALEQGYIRPAGAGCDVGLTVTGSGTARRFLTWNL